MPYSPAPQLLVLSLVFFTLSCRLTKDNVVGKWKGPHGDTLIINQNNTFALISHTTGPDILSETVSGKWELYRKSVHLDFNDSTADLNGNCSTLYYWWTRASRRTLIRPADCKGPTNRFFSYNKIQ